MKCKVLILSALLIVASCGKKQYTKESSVNQDSIYQMQFYQNATQVGENGWDIVSFITQTDTCHVIKFMYRDEVGFSFDSVYCKAVFENKKGTEYKLIAPWLGAGMIVLKSNLLMEKSLIVSKKEMKR